MNERERLQALLEACHRVLPGLTADDELVARIRETCEAVEARLAELDTEPRARAGRGGY
jgi:hypothetical protein